MVKQEWNDDYQSGMLFIGVNMKSDLLEYFKQINPLKAVADKYGLEILDGDEEGAFFRFPKGQERTLAEKLQKDKIVGNVEYVVDGVYDLAKRLDEKRIKGDLTSDILSCCTKEEVNKLLDRWLEEIRDLRLK